MKAVIYARYSSDSQREESIEGQIRECTAFAEKVIRGMTDNALKCKYNGGTLPIGYIIDEEQHFQIDPLTAPFVLDAFKKYDKGATMTDIRDWLNDSGVKNARGLPLNYGSVQSMLKNRRYIGEFKYRDIIVPDGIPVIVPQELFDRVQKKMEQNKKAPARNKAEEEYLLTTKLFCGYCGAYLCGESGKSRNGTVHHYYKCVSVKKKRIDCKKKAARKQWLEDLVVTEVMKVVMDDKAIEAIVAQVMDLQDRENTTLPVLESSLREVETGIQNILNAIQMGILTKSTKSRLEELENSKEDLEIKIANEKLAKPRISPEFVTFWLHKFRKLDIRRQDHRKWLINVFVNAIYLYDDKMIITLNYKDGTVTITLDDVKRAIKNNTGSDLDCHGAPHNRPSLIQLCLLGSVFVAPHPSVCYTNRKLFCRRKQLWLFSSAKCAAAI